MYVRKSYADRRNYKRAPVSFTVFYKVNAPLDIHGRIGDNEFNAVAIDISEGGMAIITNHAIPQKNAVTLNFTMLDDNALDMEDRSRSTTIKGEVRYCMPLKEQRAYRLGIEYAGVALQDRDFISKFVEATV